LHHDQLLSIIPWFPTDAAYCPVEIPVDEISFSTSTADPDEEDSAISAVSAHEDDENDLILEMQVIIRQRLSMRSSTFFINLDTFPVCPSAKLALKDVPFVVRCSVGATKKREKPVVIRKESAKGYTHR
jgi:hypothetical protein